MSDRRHRYCPQCWLAGIVGFFLMAGSRNRRRGDRVNADGSQSGHRQTSTSVPDFEGVSDRDRGNDLDNFREVASLESTVSPPNRGADPSQSMSSESVGEPSTATRNPLKQITVRQWLIALIVLVAVPAGTYFGAYYLYPYVQDQLEGESPIDAVLSEYGVAEDAETQLLTIRRGDLVNSVAVNGILEYANRERLSFGLGGTVESVNVDVGDFVSEGDVLMSLQHDAVVAADQKLQDASVSLQDAEQALDDLINPDQKKIDDATLKILEGTQKLADAEAKLNDLLNPPDLDIQNAALVVAKAEQTRVDAETKLIDLTDPPQIEIEKAVLAIVEATQAVDGAQQQLADLLTLDNSEIADAEHALNEAMKESDDAVEAYEDLVTVDVAEINKAELDVEKARLALLEAETVEIQAQKALMDAENALGDELSFSLEVAQSEAEIAAAKLDLVAAKDALAEAAEPYDQEEVEELREKIVEAESDTSVAQDQLAQLVIETDSESRDLEDALKDARDAYQEVFLKWLGMDISMYQWKASPDQIFADIGKTLSEIFIPIGGTNRIAQRNSVSSGWLEDDPATSWSETVVATWTEFFLSNLRFDCTEFGTGITDECVNIEFENAWDELAMRTEAYQTFNLAHSLKFDKAEDAIDAARILLDDLIDQLDEMLEPTDEDVIQDLEAKVDVAYLKHIEAQERLSELLAEFDERARNRQNDLFAAEHALAVAGDEVTVAEDELENALERLKDLRRGPSDIDLALAESRTRKANEAVSDANEVLKESREHDDEAVEIADQEVRVAEAELANNIEASEMLLDPDRNEVDVLKQEIEVARSNLQAKRATLDELTDQDVLEVELARQEIEVARTDFVVAQEDLKILVNPDPATVALRRAEVATAREVLESARAAIEQAQIVAPFDGVVSTVMAEEGEIASEGAVMVEVADASIVEVSGTVDEVDVLFLQVGDTATIELEALGDEKLVGRISDIAAFGESNQGVVTYPVTIQTEQPSDTQLPEGLSAVAEIIIREQSDQLLVPIQALFGSVNEPILLISNPDGTLEPRVVTLGISDDFWTVVENGVSEGETILMTVVGADTSQFGGFRGVRTFTSVRGGPPRR